MDGAPKPKTKKYKGNLYSETRYAVIKEMEKELPLLKGDVLEIGAGNWDMPKTLLTGVSKHWRTDQKHYGGHKNKVDQYIDVHNMPSEWDNKWDAVIALECFECFYDPKKAITEIHRVLKKGGKAIISSPFNYVWFGSKEKNVKDYWRITQDGWELLMKNFNIIDIRGLGGSGPKDRFGYFIVGVK